ncbi:MAG: head-tail connector protein [Oceanicaulis sp.]
MRLRMTSPPGAEPVSLAEAKTWLRAGHDDEDALIGDLIAAARERVETETGRALITRSYVETLERWPAARLSAFGQAIGAAVAPLASAASVTVYDRRGQASVWDPAEYRVETGDPGRIVAVFPFALPTIDQRGGRAEIAFAAGYGESADDVPAALREAVLRLVSDAYATVEPAESARRGEAGFSPSVEALIRPYRRARL